MSVHVVTTEESAVFAIVKAAGRALLSGQVERDREMLGLKEDLEKFRLAYLETLQKLYQGHTLIRPCYRGDCPHCTSAVHYDRHKQDLIKIHQRDFVQVEVKPALVPCADALQALDAYKGELPAKIWSQIRTAHEALRAFENKHADLLAEAQKA